MSIHSGSTGNIRHSPRNGLRLTPRSPRGPLALLTPSSARRVGVLANLTPAKGRQNHTASPSAKQRARQSRCLRPPHPASRFVTIGRNAPLHRDGMRRGKHNFPKNGSRIFFAERIDRNSRPPPVGQITCCRMSRNSLRRRALKADVS